MSGRMRRIRLADFHAITSDAIINAGRGRAGLNLCTTKKMVLTQK